MNVSDIIAQSTTNTGRGKSIFSSGSFLNIGKRGQVVQGVVSKVADKVSISFNGTEAAVPLSSVQNATEGETRSFKIMEVSKDKIVLKEVGTEASSGSRAMTGTTVGTSSYSFADHLSDAGKLSEAKQQAGQNIAVLTGEDYQNMESEHLHWTGRWNAIRRDASGSRRAQSATLKTADNFRRISRHCRSRELHS